MTLKGKTILTPGREDNDIREKQFAQGPRCDSYDLCFPDVLDYEFLETWILSYSSLYSQGVAP